MTKIKKFLLIAAIFLFAFQYAAHESYSQGPDDGSKKVTAIYVKNNKAISTETILSKIKTKIGEVFSKDVLNDDLKRLYATEYFTDVSMDLSDYQDGVAVTILVEEKSVIEDIVFTGNKAVRAPKLKALMKSKQDEMLNMTLLTQDIAEIKSFYVKKGYPLIDVQYAVDINKELNKAKVTITINEKQRVKVARVDITGNKAIKTGVLKKSLATKPGWILNPGVFKDDVFQEDLERIKGMYDDKGFLDAEVIPKLDYSADNTLLYITLDVKEGRQYLVGNTVISGQLTLPETDINKNIKMKKGKPFSNRELREDTSSIRQFYYRYGYMNVVIDVDKKVDTANGTIDIAYNIDSKDLVYVGKVEVQGNTKTKDIVVRRELRSYPGEKFDGDKIKRSKERLYNLGLFEDVSFDTEQTENPNVQNLIVNVKEAKTGEFSFGGGYSSIDQLIGFVDVTQRNFDIANFPSFVGGGQNLSIRGEFGFVRRNYNVSWTDPWIFGFPYSFGFDFYQATHRRDVDVGWPYDERRTGGDVKLGKEFTEYFRGDLTYRLEEVKIGSIVDNASNDLKAEEGSNILSTLGLQLTQDTRDNVFNPTKGYVISGYAEDAGGFLMGDKEYVKVTGTASYYHTFFEKFVLELKGRGGIANPYGKSDEIPIYERFFAGGENTIRGYKERRVSPRDPGSNEPIGGEALLVGNAEVTFPIYEKIIKGAVFYDVGNVWRRTEEFMVGGHYKSGTGIGVRVKTPLGPMKLDYGYPLTANENEKREGEFYFSMTHGF